MRSSKTNRHIMKDNRILLLLTIPAILYFVIFHYLPMFGVIMAFKDYKYHLGILGSEWIGFRNFEFFFTSQDAWRITRNTVGYSILFMIVGYSAATIVAMCLFEIKSKFAIKYYQTAMIFPFFVSWVLVGYISYSVFNPGLGVFNQILALFGMDAVQWYSNPKYWPYILTFFNVWKNIGLTSIILYAALMGIDSEQYEAAKIDGANRWKQSLHISLPGIAPVITILVLLSIGDTFRGDFGLFYQIPRDVGLLYPTTDIIDTYVYRGLKGGQLGMTAAVGLFQSFVGLILIILANAFIRKVKAENALF